SSRPGWWSLANGVRTLLATVAILGFAWLAVLFALEWFQIPRPPTPEVENVPWPTLALLGGLLAGFLLSVVFQQLARLGARRRAARVRRALREGVAHIAERDVIEPIRQELAHLESFCAALATLRRAGE
ncbi:MAG TPA: ABC transporter, partial [Actinomycetota bacterium]|nr:ABC transporter [Actinomycetota bacterium]